ncbi:hypothetical protein ACQJBY_064108 [Aegilops geniculata]
MHSGSAVARPREILNPSAQVLPAGPNRPSDLVQPTNTEGISTGVNFPDKTNVFCLKCLPIGHVRNQRNNKIRCRACFRYDHIARFCYNKKIRDNAYRVKQNKDPQPDITEARVVSSASPLCHSSPAPPATAANIEMACFPCNPLPHLPPGTAIIPPVPFRARHGYVVLGGELPMVCDEWAIATLVPEVSSEEFHGAIALITNYLEGRGWRINCTSRCGMATALIQFTTACSCDTAVGHTLFQIGDSVLRISRQDRGINYRSITFTHGVWILLMNYPLECWDVGVISRTVSPYGCFLIWNKDPVMEEAQAPIQIHTSTHYVAPHEALGPDYIPINPMSSQPISQNAPNLVFIPKNNCMNYNDMPSSSNAQPIQTCNISVEGVSEHINVLQDIIGNLVTNAQDIIPKLGGSKIVNASCNVVDVVGSNGTNKRCYLQIQTIQYEAPMNASSVSIEEITGQEFAEVQKPSNRQKKKS